MTKESSPRLSARATALLEASDEERIQHIRKDAFIPYAKAEGILASMEQLLTHPVSHRPPNILVVARSKNGKTLLLREFLARHPAQELRDGDAIYAPVIYLQCPPGPDENTFLYAAFRLIGLIPKNNEKPGEMQERLVEALRKVKTKVILLDELNSLLAGSVRKQLFMMNLLKYISNATSISIAAAGTKDALQVLATDAQLESRFPAHPLPRWKETGIEFTKLLVSFEHILPLRKASNLHLPPLRSLIFGLSEGLMGGVAEVVKTTAIEAIKSGEECITEEILQNFQKLRNDRLDDIENI